MGQLLTFIDRLLFDSRDNLVTLRIVYFPRQSTGEIESHGSRSFLLFDDLDDAKGAASFVEGIIHRKTKGTDEVGFGARKIGDKFTPLISWNGVEGMIDLDAITTFPRAVFGPSGTRRIPQ